MQRLFFFIIIIFFKSYVFAQLIDSRDGKEYNTVKVGEQVWMAENLAFRSNKGFSIYKSKIENIKKYGFLYDWETAIIACPDGWHLPSKLEFETLLNNYGDSTDLRANYIGITKNGASGSLGGFKDDQFNYHLGGTHGMFWSCSKKDNEKIWCLEIDAYHRKARIVSGRNLFNYYYLSVRCVKNN